MVENQSPEKLHGKYQAMVVCCVLESDLSFLGTVYSLSEITTTKFFRFGLDYHPSRVLSFVYQPFAIGTILILSYHESKINTRKRNLIGYILFTISTFLLIILDLTTKGRGGIGSYMVLCVIVASFGFADASVRGGMIGDLSLMCRELIQSFIAGLAVAGALTSAFRLITKAAFEKANDGLRKGAIIFLAISTFIEFLCVLLYAYVFQKLPIVKYYRNKAASEGSKTVYADLAAAGIKKESELTDDGSKNQRLNNKEILLENIDYAMNLFFVYGLTMTILPGFLYENTGQHGLGSWYALVLIAMCTLWDLVGRYAPFVKWLKIENKRGLTIAVLLRVFLILAFYFTAKYGDQGWMIMLVSVLGFTNGHLTVCILTTAPKGYKGPEKNALRNLLVIFILWGAFAGSALGWLWLIGKQNVF